MKRREYDDYEAYIAHQVKKKDVLGDGMRRRYNERLQGMKQRFKCFKRYLKKGSILCLGARLGEEVRVFKKWGWNATGIDINPGPGILYGDFHQIPFQKTFNNVYCNCLDHAYDLDVVADEIKRVLSGTLVLELDHLYNDERLVWESLLWKSLDEILAYFNDFRIRKHFRNPADKRFEVVVCSKKE